ncbi:MAG: hypothetical protein APF81_01065 [Desulfosporosinus sp. BRH_c37]|nr:MAG: hypothetical protein APF81_01065 [Desulfosporosinus sp. BRH_c37]
MLINSYKGFNKLWIILKRGKMLKDTVALGVVGGFLGAVAMALSNSLIYKAGKTEIRYANIAGSIFMRPFRTKQPKNFVLGEMFHLANGSASGLLMVQIFKRFGTDLALLKGSMLGMFTWEALYTAGQRLGIYTAKPHLTKTGYSAIWNNFVYGVVTAYSIRWLAHPSVFSAVEHNATQPESTDSIKNKFYQEPKLEDVEKYTPLH